MPSMSPPLAIIFQINTGPSRLTNLNRPVRGRNMRNRAMVIAWAVWAAIFQVQGASRMAQDPLSIYLSTPPVILGSSLTLASSVIPNGTESSMQTGLRSSAACGEGRVKGFHSLQTMRSFDRTKTVSEVTQNLEGTWEDPKRSYVRRIAT